MKIYYKIHRIELLPGTFHMIDVVIVPDNPLIKSKKYFPATYQSKSNSPIILLLKVNYRYRGWKRLSKKSLEKVFSYIRTPTSVRFLEDSHFYEDWNKIEQPKDAKIYWDILKRHSLGRKLNIVHWFFKEGEGLE